MGKLVDAWIGFKTFILEVKVEMHKCAWPTKPELMESTIVVVVATALFGVYVGFSDFALVKFLGYIIR
jgi:preprotein translocase SecE subunit